MRIVEVVKTFSHGGINFLEKKSYVMAEDIEAQYRNLYGDKLAMSYPLENIYKRYAGQDLNGKKILVFRTGGIGDILFLNAPLRYLKKKYPTCFLRVASGCKQSLENVPEIDELYDMPFDADILKTSDYVLYFQGILESSSEQSKITHAVDMFYSYFGIDSTHFPAEDKRPKLFFKKEEMDWMNQTFSKRGIKDTDYVVGIQMETSAPVRNFPKEKLKTIIDILSQEDGIKIVLIGTEQHEIMGNFLRGSNTNVLLATRYSVRESIVLANRYNIIVSPDTFMVQVAGALEKPLIGLYGPFPSDVRMKYFKNAIGLDPSVVCSPCFKHDFRPCIKGNPSPCFSLITPEDVLQAMDYLKFKFTGQHFKFMQEYLTYPNIEEIEKYMLSADKGLCFFGGYFTHQNVVRVDNNVYAKPDISDLNTEFKREMYPFVLYFGPIGFSQKNRIVYDGAKGLVRPGGYFIVYMITNAVEPFFDEVKKDLGVKYVLLCSKFDPASKSFIIVGRRPF